MKIGLIAKFAYPCSIENYYQRALEILGHQVIRAPTFRLVHHDLDLIIVVKWIDNVRRLKHALCPKILIFTDITTRFQDYYDSVKDYFDYIFLVHNEKNLIDNKRVFYLPVAYCPKEHYLVEGLKINGKFIKVKRDIDCLFIGTCHPNREFLKRIPEITRYGNEWGDTKDVYGDEYRNLCSRAKIIVNQHYPGDTTNMRDYEAPNFKAMIITDKTPFKIFKDCMIYSDELDLREKIRYYLQEDKERNIFAEHGYNTIKAGKFKYFDRMEELLKICGVG